MSEGTHFRRRRGYEARESLVSIRRLPDHSPFDALAHALESVAELPEKLDRIERLLHAGATPEKRLLSVREAARLLDTSERTVYDLIHAGRLPTRPIGSVAKIAVTDIDRFIESLGGQNDGETTEAAG